MIRRNILILAIAGSAASANAQNIGDVLYTSNDRDGGQDTIRLLDYSNLSASTLVSFPAGPESTRRLSGVAMGPTGEFYFNNSPFPTTNPSTASLIRVDNMFNPGLRTTTTFASADPIQQVGGMAYDSLTNNLLFANNPGSENLPLREEAILGIDIANPANISVVRQQPSVNDPRPRDFAYTAVHADRLRADNYYIGTADGGVDINPNVNHANNQGSLINRMVMNNPADPTDISYELLVDLSASVTGLSDTISLMRGIASADNGNLYIADNDSRSLYEIELDGNGDYVSISKLLDLDTAHGSRFQPMGIIFNEFTGKLNYIEQDIDSGNFERRIVELNLDGTGHSVLLDDTEASSLYAVPAPSALALLGLGGLAAARRRR
jgi:hypothetical protein